MWPLYSPAGHPGKDRECRGAQTTLAAEFLEGSCPCLEEVGAKLRAPGSGGMGWVNDKGGQVWWVTGPGIGTIWG